MKIPNLENKQWSENHSVSVFQAFNFMFTVWEKLFYFYISFSKHFKQHCGLKVIALN